ncbi:hypothetical protein BG53_13935 [Paenibacillus darwinianus]|uniref:Uncharacterized protein n=1 Tax=Paenibacillus darwinianus TaxID=1380763 RepID=A0A9W5S2J3_9BACL|nr:hypothetical protein BG52_14725 [Paenibacillus darwinianus]EXX90215.1 hypothetical protein BG53_13935 [Paenibacillus darwinianus]EXX90637.1 hypothetical protein CH50_15065 [Paenibacillus darwinianus]
MFVHHLLAAFAVNDDREVVECFDYAADLKPVGQVDRNRNAVLAQLVEKRILNIDRFVHWPLPPSKKD